MKPGCDNAKVSDTKAFTLEAFQEAIARAAPRETSLRSYGRRTEAS